MRPYVTLFLTELANFWSDGTRKVATMPKVSPKAIADRNPCRDRTWFVGGPWERPAVDAAECGMDNMMKRTGWSWKRSDRYVGGVSFVQFTNRIDLSFTHVRSELN